MAIDIRREVLILRPRAEVAAYMFDPRHEKEWTTGVVESRPREDGSLRPGSKVDRQVKFLGRKFGYTYEVTGAEPGRAVDLRVEQPFPMQVRYELADAPGGTLASIRASGDATGFFRLAAPLMARMVSRNIGRDLELLKQRIEAL